MTFRDEDEYNNGYDDAIKELKIEKVKLIGEVHRLYNAAKDFFLWIGGLGVIVYGFYTDNSVISICGWGVTILNFIEWKFKTMDN